MADVPNVPPTGAGAQPVASSSPAPNTATPAAAPAAVPGKPEESAAARFRALAKQQERLLREKQATKAATEALAAERAEIARARAEIEEFNRKKANPAEWLAAGGHNYQDLTQTVLNEGQLTAEQIAKATQAELKAFKDEQAARAKEAEEQAKTLRAQEEEQVLASFQNEISQFVDENASEFELVKAFGQSALVYSTIHEHHAQTGQLLSVPQAAAMVEKYLEAEVEKALGTSKVKSKFAPPPAPETPKKLDLTQWRERATTTPATVGQPYKPPSRTLTNSASPTTASSSSLSQEERVQRAMARVRGQLP